MIILVPIGNVDAAVLEGLRVPLGSVYREDVTVGKSLAVPPESFHPRRLQCDAKVILGRIPRPAARTRVLGVVDVDIFVQGLNFVFGLADEAERVALISLRRLRQEIYRLPRDDALFHRRTLTEAVHELGHTRGLGHCSSASCVMRFSNSLPETDFKGWDFCAACRSRL